MEYSHGTVTIAVTDNKEHPSNNYSLLHWLLFSFFQHGLTIFLGIPTS
jgi:hypothetical protein